MEEKLKKIEERIKELKKLKIESYEDIELNPPTSLDKKILKLYQEIWKEVLEICKLEKIKDMDKFDKKYPIFQFGLEDFVEDYSNILDYCAQMDDAFLENEIKMLEELMEQFKVEEDIKIENELLIIRDTYLIGKQEQAQKDLEKWMKKHPAESEGYEIKCNWELEKENPDMEKVAKIIDEAEENNVHILDTDIYDEVIGYFEKIGNHEMTEYYESLLDSTIEEDYDFEQDDFDFTGDDFDFEEDIFSPEQKQELIDEMKEICEDRIEKNKKFEQYFLEKDNQEKLKFLGPQAIFKTPEEMSNIQNNIDEYILENYNQIVKENMIYMQEDIIEIIKQVPSNGLIEKDLEENTVEQIIEIMSKYMILRNFGMAFMDYKNDKFIIHIPLIKQMKDSIKDSQIIKKEKEFNEKINIIVGMCEVYGAIKTKKVFNIMKEIYGDDDKEKFARFLLLISQILQKVGIKMDQKSGQLQFIYNNNIDEKTAKSIINANKEITYYAKEEYLKYANVDFLKETKGYKRIKEQLHFPMFGDDYLFKIIEYVLIPYTIEIRLGEGKEKKILEDIIKDLGKLEDDMLPFFNIDIKEVKKGFKEIEKEFPKWK